MMRFSVSLKAGDAAPWFSGLDPFKGRWLVLFFYPADFTSGCTAESCSFRDLYQDFKGAGAEVVGVSGDSQESHAAFIAEHRLPYSLLSDGNRALRKAFGVPHILGRLSGRSTFVIDPQGIIRFVFDSRSDFKGHVERPLAFLKGRK